MVCQACGAVVAGDVHFCRNCGAQVVAAAPPSAPAPGYASYSISYGSRVQRHLQPLGVLWCVYGALRLVRGVLAIFFLRAFGMRGFGGWPFWWHSGGPFAGPWIHALLPIIGVITVVWAALALLTGYALLTRKPWGRVLAIVAGVLSLIRIPFGTALGVYTLWVLAAGASGMEYEGIADRS